MEPLRLRGTAANGPEAKIQKRIMERLQREQWYVKRIAASAKLSGLPDLYCTHKYYKARWIEVKRPNMIGSKFTVQQLEKFPKLCAFGSGVWILTDDSDEEIKKLFSEPNWESYRKGAQIEKTPTKRKEILKYAAKGPEADIQRAVIAKLRYHHWHVETIAASMYLCGLPDLYCTHFEHRARWVEIKLPNLVGSKFTPAQLKEFPLLCEHGAGVWILTGDSDYEIGKLHKPHNWLEYFYIENNRRDKI